MKNLKHFGEIFWSANYCVSICNTHGILVRLQPPTVCGRSSFCFWLPVTWCVQMCMACFKHKIQTPLAKDAKMKATVARKRDIVSIRRERPSHQIIWNIFFQQATTLITNDFPAFQLVIDIKYICIMNGMLQA